MTLIFRSYIKLLRSLLSVIGVNMRFRFIIIFLIPLLLAFGYYIEPTDEQRIVTIMEKVNSTSGETREKHLQDLETLVNEGNAIAQYRYAEVLLKEGQTKQAMALLHLSSDSGFLVPTELLGLLYSESKANDIKLKGLVLLNEAAKKELSSSQLYLGMCFNDGECGFPHNSYLAYHWLSLALENGEYSAELFLRKVKKHNISSRSLEDETKKVMCSLSNLYC